VPNGLTVHGSGAQVRDFTGVADVVEATVAASAHGIAGRTYNIAGGCPAQLARPSLAAAA
jgi:dTDP-D-glucose 4,6-dehydratase